MQPLRGYRESAARYAVAARRTMFDLTGGHAPVQCVKVASIFERFFCSEISRATVSPTLHPQGALDNILCLFFSWHLGQEPAERRRSRASPACCLDIVNLVVKLRNVAKRRRHASPRAWVGSAAPMLTFANLLRKISAAACSRAGECPVIARKSLQKTTKAYVSTPPPRSQLRAPAGESPAKRAAVRAQTKAAAPRGAAALPSRRRAQSATALTAGSAISCRLRTSRRRSRRPSRRPSCRA
jgi:hypothetical protein